MENYTSFIVHCSVYTDEQDYWKCNFSMNPHVRRLVGLSIGVGQADIVTQSPRAERNVNFHAKRAGSYTSMFLSLHCTCITIVLQEFDPWMKVYYHWAG